VCCVAHSVPVYCSLPNLVLSHRPSNSRRPRPKNCPHGRRNKAPRVSEGVSYMIRPHYTKDERLTAKKSNLIISQRSFHLHHQNRYQEQGLIGHDFSFSIVLNIRKKAIHSLICLGFLCEMFLFMYEFYSHSTSSNHHPTFMTISKEPCPMVVRVHLRASVPSLHHRLATCLP
jgi:hypothetical protein